MAHPRVNTVYDLPTEFLKCRGFGHSWEEFVDHEFTPSFGQLLALTCPTCTTRRYDIIDAIGDVSSRWYVYPEYYKLDQPSDRAEIRLVYLDREDRKQRQRAARKSIAQPRTLKLVQ